MAPIMECNDLVCCVNDAWAAGNGAGDPGNGIRGPRRMTMFSWPFKGT
jgi:hypothetical protein